MDRINQFAFYELGQTLERLNRYDGIVRAADIGFDFFRAQQATKLLLKGQPIELGVSRARAEQLEKVINSIQQRHYPDPSVNDPSWLFAGAEQQIQSWEIAGVKRAIESFQTVFREELREAAVYRVPPKGIFDIAKLVDAADCTFPDTISDYVPEKAKDEWRAAGRCLAFGLLSASGFHVARSVEGMMETYMAAFKPMQDDVRWTWGDYVKELEKLATNSPAPDPKTVSEIRQMKDDWRNPIMHPRVVLTEAEGRMLFANGESLIIAMATEVAKLKLKVDGQALTLVAQSE